jgi:hypothetical protein
MPQSVQATSVKSSTPVLASSSAAGPASSVPKDSVKDAGRVHVGGGMMRF